LGKRGCSDGSKWKEMGVVSPQKWNGWTTLSKPVKKLLPGAKPALGQLMKIYAMLIELPG
jgi:hypothetical protein